MKNKQKIRILTFPHFDRFDAKKTVIVYIFLKGFSSGIYYNKYQSKSDKK
jgi:hypothetical protein